MQDEAILPAGEYPPRLARITFPESHTIDPILTKFVCSRWLDIALNLANIQLP